MKTVLLIGLGRFGKHMAISLNNLNHQIMAVDISEERVNEVLPFVTRSQIGDSTNEEFLQSLGVSNYDMCIVAIGNNFQSSLETTSLLKDLGAKFVLARASRDVHKKFLLRNGADAVIYPERQVAGWAAIRYSSDNILDFIEINDNFAIFEVITPESWIGKTIAQIDAHKKYNINIMAVKFMGKPNLVVSPDTVIHEGETLLVLGEYKNIQKCFHI